MEILDLRRDIERHFVGLSAASHSVKPVHIANGLFRSLLRSSSKSVDLFRFVLPQGSKGEIPKNHDLDTVYAALVENGRIVPEEVSKDDLPSFRRFLKKIVAADDGVYLRDFDSYTAGASAFATDDRMNQDGGELAGQWLAQTNSRLASLVLRSLNNPSDVITLLASPLLTDERISYVPEMEFSQLPLFRDQGLPAASAYEGLLDAANCLALHLDAHPNKLYRLRLVVLFTALWILRHLSLLELSMVPGARPCVPPWLVDFSERRNLMVSRASTSTYLHLCQSVTRFYGWAFGEELRRRFSIVDLATQVDAPSYNKKAVSADAREIWELAQSEYTETDSEKYQTLGRAMYDMLALQAEAHPINYLRQLGSRAGLFDAPVNKRFRFQQDVLEMLIRGAIAPGETVGMAELLDRLWDRYGIIVGSRTSDTRLLIDSGVHQFDSDSLRDNQSSFALALRNLDFARILADGVLQVKLEA